MSDKNTKNQYGIINISAIQKRIEDLEREMEEHIKIAQKTGDYDSQFEDKIDELKEVLTKSTPLIPEIEKAFDAGSSIESWSDFGVRMTYENSKEYVKNLKIEV